MSKRTCRDCGRMMTVDREGRFVRHRMDKCNKKSPFCPGSARLAASNVAAAKTGRTQEAAAITPSPVKRCCRCHAVGDFSRRTPDGPLCDRCAHGAMLDTIVEVMTINGSLTPEARQRADLLRRLMGG